MAASTGVLAGTSAAHEERELSETDKANAKLATAKARRSLMNAPVGVGDSRRIVGRWRERRRAPIFPSIIGFAGNARAYCRFAPRVFGIMQGWNLSWTSGNV